MSEFRKITEKERKMLDNLRTSQKPRELRGRILVEINGSEGYVTPKQLEIMRLIDGLVKEGKLSIVPSVAGMNQFFRLMDHEGFSREENFFAKMYYKQNHLKFKNMEKRKDFPLPEMREV